MAEAAYEEILYQVDDPIATIKLNRPKQLNAWTSRMAAEVKHAFAQAEQDPNVVVIILTGAGRGFCAGADLNNLQSIGDSTSVDDRYSGDGLPEELTSANPGDDSMGESFRGAYSYIMSLRKPVIAAINGPCAGMAVPIACCCDVRFAAKSAKFTTAFSQRGLIAEWGISWTLARLVGHGHAMDLILSGRKFDAAEAERIGLVNRTIADAEFMAFVEGYARDMAQNCSPTSLSIMKRQIYQDLTEDLEHANRKSFELMLESFNRPDFKEGVASFMQRRPPKFQRL